MNGSTLGRMALAIAVLGALAGCSTSAHRTESYNPSTAGYGAPASGGGSGSGAIGVVKDIAGVVGDIVGIVGLFWGMEQVDKMNDWGMAQYGAMNDQLNTVYSGNVTSYRRF